MYKQGQGMASRVGVAALLLLVGFYAGYSWYWWPLLYDMNATAHAVSAKQVLRLAGGVILFLLSGVGGFYVALVNAKASDFLIEMDMELRKVVWPPVQPLFDPKAEAWGSTYIVIACTVVLTLYIWLVDMGLNVVFTHGLLKWLR